MVPADLPLWAWADLLEEAGDETGELRAWLEWRAACAAWQGGGTSREEGDGHGQGDGEDGWGVSWGGEHGVGDGGDGWGDFTCGEGDDSFQHLPDLGGRGDGHDNHSWYMGTARGGG